MNHCQPTGTTTCSYLGTFGCEIPGWRENVERHSRLEGKILHGKATHQETLEYRTLSFQMEPTSNLLDSIYGYSCFCHPAFR